MPNPDLSTAEYAALRATIRERGTVRLCAVLIGFGVWGAVAAALLIAAPPGPAPLVPFIILVATFEINFFMHTGVERIGRYIQVFYEEHTDSKAWETTAMNYGARFPRGGLDPLFSIVFFAAALLNFFVFVMPVAAAPGWLAISLIAHLAFNYRIIRARQAAAAQRALDLERFRNLRSN
jgi:hypothetical protein